MIKISKKEKEILLSKGCLWFKDIHRTYTHHPRYYLTESEKNMRLIEQVRGV